MKKIVLVSLVLLALALPVSAQNEVSIGDHAVNPGEEIRVPIYLNDSTDVAGTTIRLDYDPSVVMAYSDPDNDMGNFTPLWVYSPDNSNNASGWITITTAKSGMGGLYGDLIIGYVRLTAVGSSCDSSPLDLSIEALTNDAGDDVTPNSAVDGSFTIEGPCPVPEILDVSVNVTDVVYVGENMKDKVKVEYTNFSSGDGYNISVYFPDGTLANYTEGNLAGANPEIIPVDYTPTEAGNYTVGAYGSGAVDSKPVDIYGSAPVPAVQACSAKIGDYVWEDTNINGIQDDGETGIEGVTVKLYKCCTEKVVATTTTDGSGYYSFTVNPGDYYVKFVAPDGYTFTLRDAGTNDTMDSDADPATGKTECTTLSSGEEDLSWDAGMYRPCMLEVQKFCSVIPPAAPFMCSDVKPIDSLTMTWDGDKNIDKIDFYRDKYDPSDPAKNLMYTKGGPIVKGDTVTATGYAAANAPNDVDWLITFEDGNTGISRFHRSCSDEDMNGAEDCGKYEGNAKSTDTKFINLWLFDGMAGNGLTLDCTPEKTELKDCTVYAPKPGSCDDGKPTALVFEYTGDACSATTNFQNGKFKCEPADLQLVTLDDVRMTKDADKISVERDGNTVKIFRSDTVGKEFPSEIKYVITDTNGNTQSQTLHTSCSQQLNVGDKFGSLILRDFIPKGGSSVPEENVIYTYRISNKGSEDVIVDVFDDPLGSIAENLHLMSGETKELTEKVLLTETGDITNTVKVTDTANSCCYATDEVTVHVLPPPPPPFECDGKITELTMIWNGDQAVRVKAWKGNAGSTLLADKDNVNVGDEINIPDYAGAPNDVIWELYYAGTENKIGESKFHISCSDSDMNGPEDCGKPQGDGKSNEAKYINDWLLEGLADSTGGILDCTT